MSLHPSLQDWESQGQYVELEVIGQKVFTIQFGKSTAPAQKTLLLLHGFPESSYSYKGLVEELQSHFERIIVFDFVGFGLSSKPKSGFSYSLVDQADVALHVWKHYGVTGGHLVGHDMGDSIATELLARSEREVLPNWFNDGFQSYTFTNGGMVLEKAQLRITQKLLLTKWGGPLLSNFVSYPLFKNQIRSASGSKNLAEEEIEIMWSAVRHQGGNKVFYHLIGYLKDRKKFQDTRWLPALKRTQIPVHLCWGEIDNVAPKEIANHLHRHVCPKAQLTFLPQTGHFCQIEAPKKVAEAMVEFL